MLASTEQVQQILNDFGLTGDELSQLLTMLESESILELSPDSPSYAEATRRWKELKRLHKRLLDTFEQPSIKVWFNADLLTLHHHTPKEMVAAGEFGCLFGALDAMDEGVFI